MASIKMRTDPPGTTTSGDRRRGGEAVGGDGEGPSTPVLGVCILVVSPLRALRFGRGRELRVLESQRKGV